MAIYVGLGSNLGDRAWFLGQALAALEARGVAVEARSSLYETAPLGIPSRQPFLNAVARVRFGGSPRELLELLRAVERLMGRRRDHPDGDRSCDLDLLRFGDQVLREPDLELPHPRLRLRRFVLEPLLQLDPGLRDPVDGTPYAEDAARLRGDPAQRCVAVAAPGEWGPAT